MVVVLTADGRRRRSRDGHCHVGKKDDKPPMPNDGHTHDTNGPHQPFDKDGKPGGYHQTCSKCGITTGTVTY